MKNKNNIILLEDFTIIKFGECACTSHRYVVIPEIVKNSTVVSHVLMKIHQKLISINFCRELIHYDEYP